MAQDPVPRGPRSGRRGRPAGDPRVLISRDPCHRLAGDPCGPRARRLPADDRFRGALPGPSGDRQGRANVRGRESLQRGAGEVVRPGDAASGAIRTPAWAISPVAWPRDGIAQGEVMKKAFQIGSVFLLVVALAAIASVFVPAAGSSAVAGKPRFDDFPVNQARSVHFSVDEDLDLTGSSPSLHD